MTGPKKKSLIWWIENVIIPYLEYTSTFRLMHYQHQLPFDMFSIFYSLYPLVAMTISMQKNTVRHTLKNVLGLQ